MKKLIILVLIALSILLSSCSLWLPQQATLTLKNDYSTVNIKMKITSSYNNISKSSDLEFVLLAGDTKNIKINWTEFGNVNVQVARAIKVQLATNNTIISSGAYYWVYSDDIPTLTLKNGEIVTKKLSDL